jgi:hypothetical protein
MEALNALRQADEVRTFPSIDMPAPIVKVKPKFNKVNSLSSDCHLLINLSF